MTTVRREIFLLVVACLWLSACHAGESRHESTATAVAEAPPADAPLTVFPPLPPAERIAPGVVIHEVSLPHGSHADRIWIYLPENAKAPLPAIFIAPAGAPPFVGNAFEANLSRKYSPEHLPYVEAGFAVVAYDVDGALTEDEVTFEQVTAAATAFKRADAGVVNAKRAIDYVLKMLPAVDAKRLYSAGHSSAGRISLLVAESDPRVAACVAFAPVTNPEQRAGKIAAEATRHLEANLPGFRDFLLRTSPLAQIAKLRCPVFLFHAEDDSVIDIAESEAFVATLKKTNPRVKFVRVASGDHYDSMVREGVPQAIAWLRELP